MNKYLAKNLEELGDHLIQEEITYLLLVGGDDQSGQNFFHHRGTRHHRSPGPQRMAQCDQGALSGSDQIGGPSIRPLLDFFLASGGGLASFPLESSVFPFLTGEESRASSPGHFFQITMPLVDIWQPWNPSCLYSLPFSWQALPDQSFSTQLQDKN